MYDPSFRTFHSHSDSRRRVGFRIQGTYSVPFHAVALAVGCRLLQQTAELALPDVRPLWVELRASYLAPRPDPRALGAAAGGGPGGPDRSPVFARVPQAGGLDWRASSRGSKHRRVAGTQSQSEARVQVGVSALYSTQARAVAART